MHMTNSLMQRGDLPSVLPTDEAAAAINRKPQTLRKWACLENGPIRPVRINGRLAWKVSDLQALLNGGANG
ncbi:DNA-binding protein [Caballeronia sp. LZ019]|uniref:DNA-binding protein n=1 Tax=Caballeronia sp. LZ019 TaxID=3038555 RepID=UPI0038578071